MARPRGNEDRERVMALLLQGRSIRDVQAATGVPRATTGRWLAAARHAGTIGTHEKAAPWPAVIESATQVVAAKLVALIQAVDDPTPETIHAVAGALKILGEIAATMCVLDARRAGGAGVRLVAVDAPERA